MSVGMTDEFKDRFQDFIRERWLRVKSELATVFLDDGSEIFWAFGKWCRVKDHNIVQTFPTYRDYEKQKFLEAMQGKA